MAQKNVCIICGKDRIIQKTWDESVDTASGTSTLTYTKYVCPDPECQKKVDAMLEAKKQLNISREKAAEAREEARRSKRST